MSFLQDLEPPLPVRENLGVVEKVTKTAKVGVTFGPWLFRNREAVSKPRIDGFIQVVRHMPGVDKIGVIGFCWGGRYAIIATHETDPGKSVDAAYACHPSLLAIPADLAAVKKPVSLAFGEKDNLVGKKEVGQIKDIFGKMSGVPTEVRIYEDQIHGFSLRGDWSSDKDKKAMDDAEKQGLDWFKKYLS
jgi:dienelactone hydrolase